MYSTLFRKSLTIPTVLMVLRSEQRSSLGKSKGLQAVSSDFWSDHWCGQTLSRKMDATFYVGRRKYFIKRNPVQNNAKKVQANFCEALILQISKTRPCRLPPGQENLPKVTKIWLQVVKNLHNISYFLNFFKKMIEYF